MELERARAALAQRWAGRLADLLEEDPGVEAELRALVQEVQAQLPGAVSAADHAAAAGRDLTSEESGGGVAAGVMHAAAIAGLGGIAIGRMNYQRPQVARPAGVAGAAAAAARGAGGAARANWARGYRLAVTRVRGSSRLCGLGGAGKTSVAVEYAHRHLAEAGLAWQFPAEDPACAGGEFGELAAQLGARDAGSMQRDPVASVHAVLAAYPAAWLLVFDNAPDRASVERVLAAGRAGRVLITSQSALWPPGQAWRCRC